MNVTQPALAPSPLEFSRRQFLKGAVTVAIASTLSPAYTQMAPDEAGVEGLIDTNVTLGRWPFRRISLDDPTALVRKLREQGVAEAWTGSFDALFHKDISAVNERLTADCAREGRGLLIPIGALNPTLSGWEEELRRCAEDYRMPGIRLHPNYHGYGLGDPLARRLLERASRYGLLVQIALIMEDERTISPLVNVPPVDPVPLIELLREVPALRVQLLNCFRTLRGATLLSLAAHGVGFDIAMLDGVEGIANLLKQIPPDRLCFGSYAPVFYFESAKLKLRESILSGSQRHSVCRGAARRFIAKR